jgi:hypothetical protein
MPHSNFADLKKDLEQRLETGLKDSIPVLQDTIAIDTKRAYTTIRVEQNRLIIGGQELYGVLREQDIKKAVDYAIFIEAKYKFVESSIPTIVRNIENAFK